MQSLELLVERIAGLAARRNPVLVAIDGCGGAGKSTLAARLAADLAAAGRATVIVHFDDFYLPTMQRLSREEQHALVGANFDWRRLREQVLTPLPAGRDAAYDRYDWATDRLAKTLVVPAGSIVLVEGVTCSRDELAALYDFRIWVDCPRDVRLQRGIERDGEESRGFWEREWMPTEDRYVREHRPHERADVLVCGLANQEAVE